MSTVSEVAEFLGVDRDTVKRWTKDFAEYLSLMAQPAKGKERQFIESDLRVLAVVAEHLELGNDAERKYRKYRTCVVILHACSMISKPGWISVGIGLTAQRHEPKAARRGMAGRNSSIPRRKGGHIRPHAPIGARNHPVRP